MRLRHCGGVPKWTMHLEPLLHNGLDILLPLGSGWAVPIESETWETRQRGGGCNVVVDISALRRNQGGLLYRFPSTCVSIRPNSTAVSRSIIPLPFDQPTELTTIQEQNDNNNKERTASKRQRMEKLLLATERALRRASDGVHGVHRANRTRKHSPHQAQDRFSLVSSWCGRALGAGWLLSSQRFN
jgi:hypothetical protein